LFVTIMRYSKPQSFPRTATGSGPIAAPGSSPFPTTAIWHLRFRRS